MGNLRKPFIQLHLSIMLAGFTGLFGKLVTLNEVDIVWYRMFFTTLILLVFTGIPRVKGHKLMQLIGSGALLGFHWILFYGSIKASNVSIGVLCYSLVGFFTAILEPIFYHRRISWVEIVFSLITVAGLLCIFSFDSRYRYGILIGVVSSFVAALFGTFNKHAIVGVPNRTAVFYEMSGGLVCVSIIIPFYLMIFPSSQPVLIFPQDSNLIWMLCLALFCTVGQYFLMNQAYRSLSAFTVSLIYNLEPCYTILIAFLAFGEAREVNFSFYIGITLIITSVLLQTRRTIKAR
jgi:drug/metabolite transporter (DMT)-like permease